MLASVIPLARILCCVAVPVSLSACTPGVDKSLLNFLPEATIVSSEPACDQCSINLHPLTDLAESRDRDMITGDIRSVLSTTEGYLLTSSTPGLPVLFGADGRFIRKIGVPGDGPDGFLGASLVRYGPADSVIVFDAFTKRFTVLSPSLEPVRTIPFDGATLDMALISDRELLLVSPRLTEDSANPYALLSLESGSVTRPSNTTFRRIRRSDPSYANRVIAPARDGEHYWSAHKLRYVIEKRRMDGTLVQVLERDAEWFRPAGALGDVSIEEQPTAMVAGLWEDPRGLLWVHTLTADGRWLSGVGQIQTVDGKPRYVIISSDLYRDTRIEVIDPATGRLVATEKIDREIPTFAPGPILARVLPGPFGWPMGEMWSVSLRGFSGR